MKKGELAALERTLGHHFQRPELLETALTHTSHAHELASRSGNSAHDTGHNEQMEFLGDAVLGLAASEELFRRYPNFHEGQLSKLRAHLVSEKHLIHAAEELRLGDYMKLGRGEEKSGGRAKPAVLVDALEAVLGAMYLDGGFAGPQRLIREHILGPELERLKEKGDGGLNVTDYKSALQEKMHTLNGEHPDYVLIKEEGPEHQKTFTVEARIPGPAARSKPEFVARATGSTKKKAEQAAAKLALDYLSSKKEETVSKKTALAANRTESNAEFSQAPRSQRAAHPRRTPVHITR
jgi:ribonuclease III